MLESMSRLNSKPGPEVDPAKLAKARGERLLRVVAERVGVHPNQLRQIEQGKSNPSSTTLLRLCLLYEVGPRDIATQLFL